MDKKLIVFENTDVEVIMVDGEPWFDLYNVGAALGYTRVTISKGKKYFQVRKGENDGWWKYATRQIAHYVYIR